MLGKVLTVSVGWCFWAPAISAPAEGQTRKKPQSIILGAGTFCHSSLRLKHSITPSRLLPPFICTASSRPSFRAPSRPLLKRKHTKPIHPQSWVELHDSSSSSSSRHPFLVTLNPRRREARCISAKDRTALRGCSSIRAMRASLAAVRSTPVPLVDAQMRYTRSMLER